MQIAGFLITQLILNFDFGATNTHIFNNDNMTSGITVACNTVHVGRCCVHNYLGLVMRKTTLCICENKEADQRLCFRYMDSTISVLS